MIIHTLNICTETKNRREIGDHKTRKCLLLISRIDKVKIEEACTLVSEYHKGRIML